MKLDLKALALAKCDEQGKHFETGVPVRFRFVRNTAKSPNFGATYGQNVEPSGRYLLHNEKPGEIPRGWESGEVSFQNPLVLTFNTTPGEVYGATDWKRRLYSATGRKGAALSWCLELLGYDGIVTVRDGATSEIVQLTAPKTAGAREIGEAPRRPKREPELVWYHGGPRITDWENLSWDRDRTTSDGNAEGAGMYWTTEFDEAARYSRGEDPVIYEGRLRDGFRRMPNVRPTLKKLLELYELADEDNQIVFISNWSETDNPRDMPAVKKALGHYTAQDSLFDACVTLYHDLFRYNADAYVSAMRSLGYDGYILDKGGDGSSSKRKHLVLWNVRAMERGESDGPPEYDDDARESPSTMGENEYGVHKPIIRSPLRRGTLVYHGTSSDEYFDSLQSPAWVSNSREVAEWFARRNGDRDGAPRMLVFRVTRAPKLAMVNNDSDWENLRAWAENVSLGEASLDPHELAEHLCGRGLDGWHIGKNYKEGSDTLLCEPNSFLEFVRVDTITPTANEAREDVIKLEYEPIEKAALKLANHFKRLLWSIDQTDPLSSMLKMADNKRVVDGKTIVVGDPTFERGQYSIFEGTGLLPLTTVKGQRVDRIGVICVVRYSPAHEASLFDGHTMGVKDDQAEITVRINVAHSLAFGIVEGPDAYVPQLSSILLHELTHIRDAVRHKNVVDHEKDYVGYLNSPHELKAFMGQVVYDAVRNAQLPGVRKKAELSRTPNETLVDESLKLSKWWRTVGRDMTPDNKAKVLRAVYRALSERGLLYDTRGASVRLPKPAAAEEAALVVYHGTNASPFERFDPDLRGSSTDDGLLGEGFYFSTDPQIGRGKATTLEAKVRIDRPLVLSLPTWETNKLRLINDALGTHDLRGAALTSELTDRGYDGVILDYSHVGYRQKEVVVFDSSQITVVKTKRAAE